jgi:hypothetical protein
LKTNAVESGGAPDVFRYLSEGVGFGSFDLKHFSAGMANRCPIDGDVRHVAKPRFS